MMVCAIAMAVASYWLAGESYAIVVPVRLCEWVSACAMCI